MNFLRYISYIIMLILLSVIGYQQFSFNRQLTKIQADLLTQQKSIYEYKLSQQKSQIEVINSINEYNNKKFGELDAKINTINTNYDTNRKLIDGLRTTTNNYETNYNSFTEDTRFKYTKTVNELFRASSDLLIELARVADKNTEAAITYKNVLDENYIIVNKYNSEQEKK